jgi:hypothetical protein
MMEPLVDNKSLNSAERATDIFRLTCSLLHEVAVNNLGFCWLMRTLTLFKHAFWSVELAKDHPPANEEPWFENEVTCELFALFLI